MKKDKLRIALFSALVFMAAVSIVLYVFPFAPAAASQPSMLNSIAQSEFLSAYGFQNGTSLVSMYQVQNGTNELVFDCNFGMEPSYYNVTVLQMAENATAYLQYSSFVSDVGLLTLCGYNATLPGCSSVMQDLYNMSYTSMNSSAVESLFIQTASVVSEAYAFVENSSVDNSSFFAPVIYDMYLLNSTADNKSAMLTALINLVPLPQYVFAYNGSVLVNQFYLDVPFQFHSFSYPMIGACPGGNVFNLVSDTGSFDNALYTQVYSRLGANVTDICINSSSNSCGNAAAQGFSFYEQG